jgi:hypothetical protein
MINTLLLLFAILLTTNLNAQKMVGFVAGPAYVSLTQVLGDEVTDGGKIGFTMGVALDLPLSQADKFSIRQELLFANLGGSEQVALLKGLELTPTPATNYYSYYALQLPILAVYKIKLEEWQFGIEAGPNLALLTSTVKEKNSPVHRKYRPLDIASQLGLYAKLHNVSFHVAAYTGLLDRHTTEIGRESQMYQNSIAFQFGYWINVKQPKH